MSVPLPATGPAVNADGGLADVVEALTARLKAGEVVDLDGCLGAHPEHAAELRRLFPALALLADPSRSASPGLSLSAVAAPESAPALGQLGDFRLLREVGRGGMGVVYEAEQLSLNRRVALKLLPFAAALDARRLQRFKNEAQAAAHLQHQHIVPVYYVGCERDVHFYAMQFIDGRTLAQLIHELREPAGTDDTSTQPSRQTPETAPTTPYQSTGVSPAKDAVVARVEERPVRADTAAAIPCAWCPGPAASFYRTAARLGVQAAEALEHAHQLGVIHRDIKPANLMVETVSHFCPEGRGVGGEGLRVWITDFGLAQFHGGTGLTMTGDLVGTLRYMSPEQALARRAGFDHRTDIYSLGVTLYELLTLKPAFAGTDRAELLRQIAFEEPRPPRRVKPAVPAELETIVLKAVAKAPDERYATAQELADDLERFLKDEPIRARRPTPAQRLRKWARRHRPVVWSAAVALAIVLTVVAASVGWTVHDMAERRTRAEQAAKDQAEQDLESLVKEVIWLRDQGKAAEALAAARRAESRAAAGEVSPERRDQVAQLRKDADMMLDLEEIRLKEPEDRTGQHERYAAAFEKYGIPVLALTAEEAAARVKASRLRDQLVVALDEWTVATHPPSGPSLTPPDAKRKTELPRATARLADADPRRQAMREAWLKQDWPTLKHLGSDTLVLDQPAATLVVLARMLASRSTEAGIDLLRQAQRRYPDDLQVNHYLAWLLTLTNPPHWEEAGGCYRAALARRPRSSALRLRMGAALEGQGKLAEAEAEYRAVIALQPTSAAAHYKLGGVLRRQGRLADAEAAFRVALPYDAAPLAQSLLAETLAMQGKWRQATAAFAEAEELVADDAAHWDWFQSSVLLLHLGDVEGYRRNCGRMLHWDSRTEIPAEAEQTAKTCALAPGAVPDFQRVVALADLAVKKQPNDRWILLTRGLVAYRADRPGDAIAWLKRVAPRADGDSLDATAFAVLALAQHRLCQADDARAALTKALAILTRKMPRSDKGQSFDGDWHNWLRSKILCREAEQQLGRQASP
jgi:serine/threonine protein kinase/uncharacterized protein HemY